MSADEPQKELLLRFLEDRVTDQERRQVNAWLGREVVARAFLREIAEQSILIADLARLEHASTPTADRRPVRPARRWPWALAAASVAAVVTVVVVRQFPAPADASPPVLRISKLTGASQHFGARGRIDFSLAPGTGLKAGDTLETRSCDAWIELELRDGSKLTLAGHSTLRILEDTAGNTSLKLLQGNLWVSPAQPTGPASLVVQTPTLSLTGQQAQFDLQASPAESLLRVNAGTIHASRQLDGQQIKVAAGQQLAASLTRTDRPDATPQPQSVSTWAGDLWFVPDIILGQRLPPNDHARARLAAEPLLWPPSGRDPTLLHAVALNVTGSNGQPVQLRADAQLVFSGRTARPHTVRFGFSTQRMRGVFAGKFELDVPSGELGNADQPWQVSLPLKAFRPLHPELAADPTGLEVKDVYALTIREDVGLEIHHVELVHP
jgi:ferric-dicitrate binding protein FerR (iron transport regulator)